MRTTDTSPASPAPNRAQVSQASTLIGAGLAGGVSLERLAMKTNQHTPGPWSIYEGENNILVIEGGDGNDVANIIGSDLKNPEIVATTKADASLIASAPDLLAACKAVDDAWTGGENGDWRGALDRALGMARAAIAKAEGGAE